MFYNVSYEGHNAVVHAVNIASAQAQLEWCVENGVFGTAASRMYSTVFSDDDVSWDYEVEDNYQDDYEDGFPYNVTDLSDDADALASAGMGTDEDYGYFGGDDEW